MADSPGSERGCRKWRLILAAFDEGRWDDLRRLQRTGTRGRIFAMLVRDVLRALGTGFREEPTFAHKPPDPWYVGFSALHGLKLRTHPFYNPDFVLEDGDWLEASLNENTAYQKVFRYGHQAPRLSVLWLDEGDGLHKEICQYVAFPNAEVKSIESLYVRLRESDCGAVLVEKCERLKALRGVIL